MFCTEGQKNKAVEGFWNVFVVPHESLGRNKSWSPRTPNIFVGLITAIEAVMPTSFQYAHDPRPCFCLYRSNNRFVATVAF